MLWNAFIAIMMLYFVFSIVESLAQQQFKDEYQIPDSKTPEIEDHFEGNDLVRSKSS